MVCFYLVESIRMYNKDMKFSKSVAKYSNLQESVN